MYCLSRSTCTHFYFVIIYWQVLLPECWQFIVSALQPEGVNVCADMARAGSGDKLAFPCRSWCSSLHSCLSLLCVFPYLLLLLLLLLCHCCHCQTRYRSEPSCPRGSYGTPGLETAGRPCCYPRLDLSPLCTSCCWAITLWTYCHWYYLFCSCASTRQTSKKMFVQRRNIKNLRQLINFKH
jgi:hypothetical protein